MAVASMRSPLLTQRPLACPRGASCYRIWACLALTLPQVGILLPTKQPRGQALSLELPLAHQALYDRRWRMEHVNSSVQRCRVVTDRIRLWKAGVRDVVIARCCAVHTVRVHLAPRDTLTCA
jgi:hypothetical protein